MSEVFSSDVQGQLENDANPAISYIISHHNIIHTVLIVIDNIGM